jgi:hypothetical protein
MQLSGISVLRRISQESRVCSSGLLGRPHLIGGIGRSTPFALSASENTSPMARVPAMLTVLPMNCHRERRRARRRSDIDESIRRRNLAAVS